MNYSFQILLFWLLPQFLQAQCSLSIDAGENQELCAPGGTVQLQGSILGDAEFFYWSPGTAVSDSTILNPTADVFQTTLFTLKAYAFIDDAENLVENGDFEQGDTLFRSDYVSETGLNLLLNEGSYQIATSPSLVHTNFPPCDDHTKMDGTGNMMVLNGARDPDTYFFCQDIAVTPNTYYNLEAWMTTVFPVSAAELQFVMNGEPVGDVFVADLDLCSWVDFGTIWYSGDLTSVELCLVDHNTEGFGNDFAIDDISMTELCEQTDEVLITVNPPEQIFIDTSLCEGESLSIGGVIYDQTGSYYDLQVTDDQGCHLIYNLDLQIITIDILERYEPVINCVDTQITIGVLAVTSAGTLNYNWSTTDGNFLSDTDSATVQINQSGNYTLTIKASHDGVVCEEQQLFVVIEDTQTPVADAGPDQVISCDTNIVTLDGSASSAGGEFIYEWKNPLNRIISDANKVNVGLVGTYVLTVTNIRNGCISTDTVELNASADFPVVNLGPDTMLYCHQRPYRIEAQITNVDSFSAIWSSLDTNNTIRVLNPITAEVDSSGYYVLNLINTANQCQSSDTIYVEIQNTLPQVQLMMNDSLDCLTTELELHYTYDGDRSTLLGIWDGSEAFQIISDTGILVRKGGWYYLSLVDTLYACSTSDSLFVFQDTMAPIANAGPDLQIHCKDTLSLSAVGSSQGDAFEYLWTSLDGNIIGNPKSLQIQADRAGRYILRVLNTTNFCSAEDTLNITTDRPPPVVNILPPDTLSCYLPQLVLHSSVQNQSPNLEYLWTTTDGNILGSNTNDSIRIDQHGRYILHVVDTLSNCTAIDSVEVTSDFSIGVFTIVGKDTIRCGDNAILIGAWIDNSDDDLIYQWTTTDGNILSGKDSLFVRVNRQGIYIFSVTDLSSGCNNTDSVFIYKDENIPLAEILPPDTLNCARTQILLDGSQSTVQNADIHWATIGGNIVHTNDSLKVIVDQAGTYILSLTKTENDCTSSDTVVVFSDLQYPDIRIDSTGGINCKDSVVVLDASTSIGAHGLSFLWSGPDIDQTQQKLVRLNQAGNYLLILTDTVNQCRDSLHFDIQEDRNIPFVAYDSLLSLPCPEAMIVLKPKSNYQDHFIWNWTGTSNVEPADSSQSTVKIRRPGLYYLRITNPDNHCRYKDTIQIDEDSLVVSLETIDPACKGEQGVVRLIEEQSTPGIYSAEIGQEQIEDFGSISLYPGEYIITLHHENTCKLTRTIQINEPKDRTIDIEPTIKINLGEQVRLNPVFNFDTSRINSFQWIPNQYFVFGQTLRPVIKPLESIDYTLFIRIDSLCDLTARTRILVNRPEVFIPKAFTPNGDGMNDRFRIYANTQVQHIEDFAIFNRWGNLVFRSNLTKIDDEQASWDGRYLGRNAEPGVYTYLLKIRFINGTTKLYKGDISLIR